MGRRRCSLEDAALGRRSSLRQGPHHVAQKSTTTGVSELICSLLKSYSCECVSTGSEDRRRQVSAYLGEPKGFRGLTSVWNSEREEIVLTGIVVDVERGEDYQSWIMDKIACIKSVQHVN